MLETSTDMDKIAAAAGMLPEIEWPAEDNAVVVFNVPIKEPLPCVLQSCPADSTPRTSTSDSVLEGNVPL